MRPESRSLPSAKAVALRRAIPIAGLLALSLACGAPAPEPEPEPAPETPVRTADPFARGLTEADFPRTRELAPGVYSYEQLRAAGEELFTTVSLFVVTDAGVLVADGQGSAEETARLVAEIGEITDRPITHVVVASDHGDHTAGNSAFPEGVEFIVHENSVPAMEALRERIPDLPMPQTVIGGEHDLDLAGRRIEIRFLGRAHTGGDLVVYLPAEGVLFLTEAYLHRVFPAMRSAYPSEWVEMLRRAQAIGAEWNIPGHGFVDDPEVLREELGAAIAALETVIAEATRLHGMGLTLEEAEQQADFGDLETWSLRDSQRGRAIARVYMELNGELPDSPSREPGAPVSSAPRGSSSENPDTPTTEVPPMTTPDNTDPAHAADGDSPESVVAALYASVSGPAGAERDWTRFRSLFAPGARLMMILPGEDGRNTVNRFTPEEYESNAMEHGAFNAGFFEYETGGVTESHGAIAHRFGSYAAYRSKDDEEPLGRGLTTSQFVHDGERWLLLSFLWQDIAPGEPLPARYLDPPPDADSR